MSFPTSAFGQKILWMSLDSPIEKKNKKWEATQFINDIKPEIFATKFHTWKWASLNFMTRCWLDNTNCNCAFSISLGFSIQHNSLEHKRYFSKLPTENIDLRGFHLNAKQASTWRALFILLVSIKQQKMPLVSIL